MNAPLRFCMVTTFYPPYSFGGDAVAVQRLARALVHRGHHVTVVHDLDAYTTLGGEPRLPVGPVDDDGVSVAALRSRLGRLSPLATHQTGRPVVHGRTLARLLGDGRFDVVHFHNVSLVGGPGILAAAGGRAVRLYTAHEHWLVCPTHVLWRHAREPCTGRQCLRCTIRHRRPPQIWRYTGYLRRQLAHIDAFIALSEFSRAKHHEFGFPHAMTVIPNFLPNSGPANGLPPHPRPYFLCCGRLERLKGLDDVVRAFTGHGDADLLVAGEGTQRRELEALAARSERVHFLGLLEPDELTPYYAHALSVVASSRVFETFATVPLEAFRQGTPVLARRHGTYPELVERSGGGLLFGDEDELLAGLRSLQDEPELRKRLGARARRAFEDYWSEDVVLPRYLQLVAELRRAKASAPGPAPPGAAGPV